VVPSFNQGRFLKRTLASLVREAGENDLEVIVQDAHSTDDTASVLDLFRNHEFMRIYVERDTGQSAALARGFARATGDIVGWLNSDDVLCVGALQAVRDTFESNPGCDLVYGDAVFIDENDRIINAYPTAPLTLHNLRHRCVVSQPSVFMTRQSYEQCGGVRAELCYCMDYDLWTRLLLGGAPVAQVDRILSATRIHSDTKTSNGGLPFIQEIIDMQYTHWGSPSTVWRVYERTRSAPLTGVSNKMVKFLLAGVAQCGATPRLILDATRSLTERLIANMNGRRLLAERGLKGVVLSSETVVEPDFTPD
jgi:glycosyltransferase involved in cell wall biosynthesis